DGRSAGRSRLRGTRADAARASARRRSTRGAENLARERKQPLRLGRSDRERDHRAVLVVEVDPLTVHRPAPEERGPREHPGGGAAIRVCPSETTKTLPSLVAASSCVSGADDARPSPSARSRAAPSASARARASSGDVEAAIEPESSKTTAAWIWDEISVRSA